MPMLKTQLDINKYLKKLRYLNVFEDKMYTFKQFKDLTQNEY